MGFLRALFIPLHLPVGMLLTDEQTSKTSSVHFYSMFVYQSRESCLPGFSWAPDLPHLSHFLKSLPQPISEWSIITNVELGISIESRETLRKWRACSEIITHAAVSHQQYKEPREVHTCFGHPPCLICWCLIAVNVILMIGKLWVLTLPLAFIVSIVLLGMLWSS